jgi:hypothetical protein
MADNLFTSQLSSDAQNAAINAYRTDGSATSTSSNHAPPNTAGSETTSARGKGSPEFRYPQKALHNKTDYIKIVCYEYEPPGLNTLSEKGFTFAQNSSDDTYKTLGTKSVKGTIFLPMPQTIPLNGQSVSWGEGRMGPTEVTGVNVAMKTIKDGPLGMIDALTATAKGIGNAAQTSNGQKAIQSFFAVKGLDQLLGQNGDLFNQVFARNTGAVFNENVELLFDGINLRSAFDFSFDLAPRDEKEAQVIRNMVIFLKKHMSARKGNSGAGSGLFLTAPNVFKIEYMSGANSHPYLNKFKMCALQNLSLNFTGSNTYTTYSDGTPVHMNLSLTFQELTPIYNEDYAEQNETGVGY